MTRTLTRCGAEGHPPTLTLVPTQIIITPSPQFKTDPGQTNIPPADPAKKALPPRPSPPCLSLKNKLCHLHQLHRTLRLRKMQHFQQVYRFTVEPVSPIRQPIGDQFICRFFAALLAQVKLTCVGWVYCDVVDVVDVRCASQLLKSGSYGKIYIPRFLRACSITGAAQPAQRPLTGIVQETRGVARCD